MRMTSALRTRRTVMTAATAVAGIVTCLSVSVMSVPSQASVSSGAAISASAARQLTAVALRVARVQGDGTPTSVLAVRTTHGAALRLATPGDREPGAGRAAYLVVMKGNFKPAYISIPPGAHMPSARWHWTSLRLVIDPSTMAVTDLGIGLHGPAASISRLGRVTNLLK